MNITFEKAPSTAVAVELLRGEATKLVEDAKGRTSMKLPFGAPEEFTRRKLILSLRKIVRLAREHRFSTLSLDVGTLRLPSLKDVSDYDLGRLLAENFEMANYEFTRYKTPPKGGFPEVKAVYLQGANADVKRGVRDGQIVAREINFCRSLANTPGGDMTPAILAADAKRQLAGTSAKVTVLSKPDLKNLKAGLILGVAKGSIEEPKLIIAEYWGAGKSVKERPIVLVGKGITFDTGGINLKPTDALSGMNHDMAGGAAVIATVAIAARMKLKKNVIAIVPAVENAVSGSAYRPGDVLTAMNKKTVEVLNTDAEGRLILGDALTYAERYQPRLVIDVATLTGAAIVALGKRASAIMTRDEKLERLLRDLGEESGEYVWPLPLWKEYEAEVKGIHADLANSTIGKPGGGTINGGTFLAQFAGNFEKWAHIDIAPRMESISDDNLAKGATGTPIRLLARLVESY